MLDDLDSLAMDEADHADLPEAGVVWWWSAALVALLAWAAGYLSAEVGAVAIGPCLVFSKQRSELRAIRLELRRLAITS
jgi:hypothetical protein